MESVLRSVSVYLIVLAVFRVAGKRSLSQITMFDFVLLLIIGESTQQALLGHDASITNACVVIATLVMLDVSMGWLEGKYPRMGRVVSGLPVVVLENGKLLDTAEREGVTLPEILAEGRDKHGLERLEQYKYAILERHGGISVVPADSAR